MSESRNRVLRVLVVLLTIACVGLFLIPAFVIRPFRYQSTSALALAIRVKWMAPALTAVACAIVLALCLSLWRSASRMARAGLVAAMVLSVASAVMTRLNYFEWMFRPIQAAGFIAASDAHFSDKEMVMAVHIGPDARAYPIRQMAYHHILNDTVGGEPIVVTY
jgi:chromate transport protein ChrA